MTRYAFDEDRRALVRTFETPAGDTASDLMQLDNQTAGHGQSLARALTRLSVAFWRNFTHSASFAHDDLSLNTEGWRREGERGGFDTAVQALTEPNLPSEKGTLIVSYVPTEEAGHHLGRLLSRCDSADLTFTVVAEVQAEANAIERAEAGDLSGRSQQATTMSRPVASPLQVNAAHEILTDDPLAPFSTFKNIEPVSAAVAAAHWLQCAARIASKASGISAARIVMEADNIEALPWERPSAILRKLKAGETAEKAVTSLIQVALNIADGDLDAFLTADTVPDISRPGPDLLEDLLYGIYGSALIWDESDADEDEPVPDGIDDDDEEYWDARFAARREVFIEKLRKRATKAWH